MLKINNISKLYKQKKYSFLALDNINLNFPSKGLIFIVGKSGSGKTTLMNILGGLDKYTEGEILFKNKSTKNFNDNDFDNYRNSVIGFIFQDYNLLDDFTIYQNISISLELQGKKVNNQMIKSILEKVNLINISDRSIKDLSGGQKQRVAIARAIIKNPEIIIGDEPTAALDSKTSKNIFEIFQKISKEKLVIIISHDLEAAYNYGDRVIELADGKIINDKTRNNKNIFEETLKLKQNAESIKDSYKCIKSRLPFSKSFKIAINNIKKKITSLCFNIFLSVFALVFCGLALTFYFYDKEKVSIMSLKNNPEIPLIIRLKNIYSKMTNSDIEILKNKYPEADLQSVYSYEEYYFSSEIKEALNNLFRDNQNEITEKIKNFFIKDNKRIDIVIFDNTENFWNNIGYQKPTFHVEDNDILFSNLLLSELENNIRDQIIDSEEQNRILNIINFKKVDLKNEEYNFNKFEEEKDINDNNLVDNFLKRMIGQKLNELDKKLGNKNLMFISQTKFNNIFGNLFNEYTNNNWDFGVKRLIGNKEKLNDQQLKNLICENKISNFSLQNIPTIFFINVLNPILIYLVIIFGFLGLNYAIFTVILMFNFISDSIKNKIKDIGVLKAIGANKFDIMSIFIKEVLIIAIINCTLSLSLIYYIINFINKKTSNLAWINIMDFNFKTVFILVTMTLTISLISTFYQIIKISRKKPIDIILNK
ncbi:ABC-type lipoprotein transport system, ATP-binding protein/permease protein [Candidatus Phytoplasma solani]|uniref:ABC transporter ATP-binding protein/permease n=1 Tax=Candidatus Phytoplasma solani TaxID=69896 RepID=UPI0032DB2A03